MATRVVGRDEELSSVSAFLDRKVAGPTAIVLEGEAGIGKSTLWLTGVDLANAQGFRVLSARPAEAEQGLAHAGLGDLFEDVLDSVLPELTAPRRRAIEIALLIEDGAGNSDPRTLGVAVRNALEVLVAETPVVLAVDDVQWLDPSSSNAIAFALRRMEELPVRLLLARRLGDGAKTSELEHAIGRDRVTSVAVGPLSLGATHQLLQAKLGRPFARPTLLRVHETSGGNPLYALELGRVLGDDIDPMQPLRIPETLEELVRARLHELPPDARRALRLAAVLGRPRARVVLAAGITDDMLQPAFAAHVIEREDDVIRFTHPLLASVLYNGMSSEERQRGHALVAPLVDDPLDRARHLALSTASADAGVAAVLENASSIASARAAPIAAAELGEHALRLTPSTDDDNRHRRSIAAARAHLASGELRRARKIAGDLLARTPSGPSRAEGLVLLADLENIDRAIALLDEALGESATRPALQADIHQRLAVFVRLTENRDAALGHARASLELAELVHDDVLRAGALTVLTALRFDVGDPEAPHLAEQAHAAALAVGGARLSRDSSWALAHVVYWSAEPDQARELLESQLESNDESWCSEVRWFLAFVELRAGNWALAEEHAEHAREVGAQYSLEIPQLFLPIALVAAHRGDLDRARDAARRGQELAERQGAVLPGLIAVAGLVALWTGDEAAAVASFATAEERADALGLGEPNMRYWRADYAEALLELDRADDAIRVLDDWEAGATRVGRRWVLAQAARSRGLVAAANGDVERARVLLGEAIGKHEAIGDDFGRSRALLALGVVTRRARQKRAAREAIEAALEGFERLGAAGWADTARSELGRVGGRTRSVGLTPAERRVADLVAQGRTNREVASTLFLGERTVASHLTHIYAKLDVRSRTELARKLR